MFKDADKFRDCCQISIHYPGLYDAINSLKGQEQNKNNFQTLYFKSQKKKNHG